MITLLYIDADPKMGKIIFFIFEKYNAVRDTFMLVPQKGQERKPFMDLPRLIWPATTTQNTCCGQRN